TTKNISQPVSAKPPAAAGTARQLSPEDLAQVPANSTSNILNRLMVSYDPRIRPNFQGKVPVYTTTMQNYICLFIKSKHISQNTCKVCTHDFCLKTDFGLNIYDIAHEIVLLFFCDLVFMWQSDPVQMDEIALPQFDIKQEDIKYGNCTKYYQGTGYYTCVEVIFTLRRQVGFYLMGVYAPTLLIVVLSWLSFWINPDASAARVPLGILSVLSLSSESMSLASELPKVSYVKAIDIWLIACLLFGFSSLVEYAVVQVSSCKQPLTLYCKIHLKSINVVQSACVFYQVVETRCKKVCTSKSDLRSSDFSIVGSLPRDFELSNFDCYGKPVEVTGALKSQNKANKKPPPPKPVIPAAAKRIDLYARALFPFSFLFFNVVYWSIYL
uniref:Glycine receptor, beta a n=1 Tax=Haplochromis burtoni TaxID=8153 RepID=A0A3Q2V8G8_HAPBU